MIPDNITREHLKQALKEIDEQGVSKKRKSSIYNLIYEDKMYPPKLVISIANKYVNGNELDSGQFNGGQESNDFLKARGFEISQKEDPIITLIENYKKRISENKLKDEKYKWESVKKYNKRPNIDADDFTKEIKDIKFPNVIFHMGVAVVNHIADDKPEELRGLFKNLFDESTDLTQRVKAFNKDTLALYRDLGETLSHHQDERSISTYLTFHNPNKYTFYKNSFYKKYCKLLGIKAAKKNEKYVHYLELINDLINNYIIPDGDLTEQVKRLIPEYYDGTNHNILAQDILYQMLDQEAEINYWIFQGNPKIFDFETALKENILTDWTVSAHKDKIKEGDKVILWITGDKSGCYALGEVTSEPHIKTSSPDDHLWKEEDNSELKADIKITHNLISSPILKDKMSSIGELKDLKIGNQGTNFSATKEEYTALLKLVKNPNLFEQTKNKFDKKVFDTYIHYLRKIIRTLDIQQNDERVVYSIRDNRLNFTVGQRYCFNLFYNDPNGIYGVISKDKLLENSEPYNGVPPKPYYNYYQDFSLNDTDWSSMIDAIKSELERTVKSGFRKHNDLDFENYVFEYQYPQKEDDMNFPLNTILYGPPGTGKTYSATQKALQIIDGKTYPSHEEAKKRFNELQDSGQIQMVTFHQSYGYEEFVEGLSAETVNGQVSYNIKDGIFKNIVHEAKSLTNEISENMEFDELYELYLEQLSYLEDGKSEKILKTVRGIEFELFRNSSSIVVRANNNTSISISKNALMQTIASGKAPYYVSYIPVVLDDVLNGNQISVQESSKEKKYVLIIDEINRGNISKIFGELITLVEASKRLGARDEIKVILPYSKEDFSIPSNLYVVGTMNTADRSIALLDTALRRRFHFEEMMPDINLVKEKVGVIDGIDVAKMLQRINKRIEVLYDRDHMIGHSYLLDVKNFNNLKNVMKNKIIPLLQEYFYDDWQKINMIFNNNGFIEENEIETDLFSDIDDFDFDEEQKVYTLNNNAIGDIEMYKVI